jgi:hypothetical protein
MRTYMSNPDQPSQIVRRAVLHPSRPNRRAQILLRSFRAIGIRENLSLCRYVVTDSWLREAFIGETNK